MKPFEYLRGASRRGPFSPGMSGTFAFSLLNTQFFILYFLLVPRPPLTRHLRFLHPGCFCGTERSRPTFSSRFAPAIEDSDLVGKASACGERPLLHPAWYVCVMESLCSPPPASNFNPTSPVVRQNTFRPRGERAMQAAIILESR